MPRTPPKHLRVNPAVAALGAGVRPDRWEAPAIIESLFTRYLQLIQQAEEYKLREQHTNYRIVCSGAYELASVIASYQQDHGPVEELARWTKRRDRTYAAAYSFTNKYIRDTMPDANADPARET